jgi:two-component system response regulator NreC
MKRPNIRILVADDHSVVREGIRALLEREPDMTVVGESGDGLEALAKFRELTPDIMLLDISMPKMTGLEVAKVVKQENSDGRVVLLTMHEGEEYFFRALAVGAAGYVVKGASAEELLHAIRSVNQGGVYLQPSLQRKLVSDYLRHKTGSVYDGLTPRESEVLHLIADGLANKQIVAKLSISITTVQTHRAHVMEKLNLHSQAELMKYALRKGILSPD